MHCYLAPEDQTIDGATLPDGKPAKLSHAEFVRTRVLASVEDGPAGARVVSNASWFSDATRIESWARLTELFAAPESLAPGAVVTISDDDDWSRFSDAARAALAALPAHAQLAASRHTLAIMRAKSTRNEVVPAEAPVAPSEAAPAAAS